MAFKASKKRQQAPAQPMGRGLPIIPSAAIEAKYRRDMNALTASMLADYKERLEALFQTTPMRKFFAMDAAVPDSATSVLKSLQQRWSKIFENFAKKAAPEFVDDVEQQATAATLHSLSVAGVKAPTAAYNENIANTIKASKDYNFTLITNISKESHEKIYSAVMLSLTSPNPEEQGLGGIRSALIKEGIESKNRIKLIAKDQTSKLYASLSDERLEENGCEEFEWLHSSAGKVPRQSHVEKDGQIFKLNDPKLWEGKKADQGPPGWAINCRCRKVPVYR